MSKSAEKQQSTINQDRSSMVNDWESQEQSQLQELIDIPFHEHNIGMLQKFIHRHADDLQWDYQQVLSVMIKY